MTPSDTLTLELDGRKLQGWTDVRVTRGIERMPSDFQLKVTERFPGLDKVVAADPGQTCTVKIGDDLVLTGYVDIYGSVGTTRAHEISVSGRSQTEDLVDCQAGMSPGKETSPTLTIRASTFLQLATDLCAPFDIAVTQPDGPGEPLISSADGIPQFSISLGQTVYDVLEPISRWQRLLMIDGADGNLILAKVGKKKAASGFAMPGNLNRVWAGFRKGERYSVYVPARFSFDQFNESAKATGRPNANYYQVIQDEAAFAGQSRRDGQKRYRPLAVVSEQTMQNINLAENRAKWEKARRYGRSQSVTIECATWRDSGGKLWEPNTLAAVNVPTHKLANLMWLITEVTFLRGFEGGTRAIITLMPPEAFEPEPSFFTPFDPQVAQAQEEFDAKKRAEAASSAKPTSPYVGDGTGGL